MCKFPVLNTFIKKMGLFHSMASNRVLLCTRLIRKRVCFALWSEAGHGYVLFYGLKMVWIFNNLIGKFVSFLLSNEVSYGFL